MTSQAKEEFMKAWKARFPDDHIPPLDCFDVDHLNTNSFTDSCQLQYDSTRHNIEMLQKEVHQQEFIASFLFDAIRNPPDIHPSLDSDIPLPSTNEPEYHGYASVDIVSPLSRSSSKQQGAKSKLVTGSHVTAPPVTAPPSESTSRVQVSDIAAPDESSSLTKQAVEGTKLKKKSSSKVKTKSSRTKAGSKKVKEKDKNLVNIEEGGSPVPVSIKTQPVSGETEHVSGDIIGSNVGNKPLTDQWKALEHHDLAESGQRSCSLETFQKINCQTVQEDHELGAAGNIYRSSSNPNTLEEIQYNQKPVPAPRTSALGPVFKVKNSSTMEQPVMTEIMPSTPQGDVSKSDMTRSSTKKKGPPPPAKPIRTSSLDLGGKLDAKLNAPVSLPVGIPTTPPTISNVEKTRTIDKPSRRKPRNTYEEISLDYEPDSWSAALGGGTSDGSGDINMISSNSGGSASSGLDSKGSPNIAPKPKINKDNRPQVAAPERLYEEALPVTRESIDEASSSDEDEPIYFNILLLKQQQTYQSQQLYASVDIVSREKQTLEKALNLTKPFSHSVDDSLLLSDRPAASLPSNATNSGKQKATVETQAGIFGGTNPDGSVWRKRGSMTMATESDSVSEDETTHHIEVVVPLGVESEKTQTRKLLVTSILHSEHAYVASLDILMQYMQTFKNVADTPQSVITSDDIKVIFFKIPELHQIHYRFIRDLEPKVQDWKPDQEIAENFKILALAEYPVATDYLANYHKAVERINKCTSENAIFRDLTQGIQCKGVDETPNLEELVHKPVVRFQRNSLVLHDLIACTPASHKDYDLLQKTLRIAQNFLENFQNPKGSTADIQRYLAKQGLIVERAGTSRKLRHVFLFNDIIVCSKQKLSKQKIHYEIKWYIPLADLAIDGNTSNLEDSMAESHSEGMENLRQKVSQLQGDLHEENKKARQSAEAQKQWSLMGHNSRVEKIKKKLIEQEAQLVLTSPQLALRLRNRRTDKAYTFLMASDYERVNWHETIDALQAKVIQGVQLSAAELQNIVNSEKLPRFQAFGDDFGLEEEQLYGSLMVSINKLQGLTTKSDVFCIMEVDTFSHFFPRAKTNILSNTLEPIWNEDFDIDLEGSQTLRILCYKLVNGTEILVGKCALELSKAWLRGDFHEESVLLNKELSLIISLRYMSREITLKRTPSAVKSGLFGVKIGTVTKREGTRVPVVVSTCVKEIEARGINDIGIYRISGVSAEIQRLKKAFEKNSRGASEHAKETDVNVLTGLLKLYFRELPEALFTDTLYPSLIKGMSLTDAEAKEKFMLSLIYQLPEPNKTTVYFMLDHLLKIAEQASVNKMSLHNLATVFGPTLLKPASKDNESLPLDQLFTLGARDAMIQTGLLLYFLQLRQKGVDFNSARSLVTTF